MYRSVYEAFQKAFRNVDKDGLEEDEDFSHDDSMWPYGILSNRGGRRKTILEKKCGTLLNFVHTKVKLHC